MLAIAGYEGGCLLLPLFFLAGRANGSVLHSNNRSQSKQDERQPKKRSIIAAAGFEKCVRGSRLLCPDRE
jgi:hypothetical protein